MTKEKRQYMVVGLGNTGESCVRFLCAAGHDVIAVDNRDLPPGLAAVRRLLPETKIFTGGFPDELVGFSGTAVISPGIPTDDPFVTRLKDKGAEICGDIELFGGAADAPVLAVTGSNGKSTVTTMLGEVLQRAGLVARCGGNLGKPALDLLSDTVPDYYVLELSSFQLDLTRSLNAFAGVLLNVSADHMDRYRSVEHYAESKARLLAFAEHSVFNRDDPIVARMAAEHGGSRSFGLGRPETEAQAGIEQVDGREWLGMGSRRVVAADKLNVRGKHNIANALAVLCIADLLDLDMSSVAASLEQFEGLPHRLQLVIEAGGVTWLDDSKGTNVGATLAALDGLAGPIILIAGGDGKGADFSALADAARGKVRSAILFGKDAARLEQVLEPVTAVTRTGDLQSAVTAANADAKPGDTVLFSPACSSLDMFSSFVERGEAFVDAVKGVTG